jgi:hypothetical protein
MGTWQSAGRSYHFTTDELNLANPETVGSVLILARYQSGKTYKSVNTESVSREKTADSIMTMNCRNWLMAA